MDRIIPDTELMAEKLGIIDLCQYCGYQIYKNRDWWLHTENDAICCSSSIKIGPNSWKLAFTPAKPRKQNEY